MQEYQDLSGFKNLTGLKQNLTPQQQQRFRFKRLTDANPLGNLRIDVDGVK